MSDRVQLDYRAFCLQTPRLETARIFSLKLEQVDFGNFRRRYVDALLIDGSRLVPVLFIFVAEDGTCVFHEKHAALAPGLRDGLAKSVQAWVQSKPSGATMEADLFERNTEFRDGVLQAAQTAIRPLPGLASYDQLFTEGERYANLTPYVANRRIVDFNPGFGYGIRTLEQTASSVAAVRDVPDAVGERLLASARRADAEVAVYLDLPAGDPAPIIQRLRASAGEQGTAIVSVRSAQAADLLRESGANVTPMFRAAADAAGSLGEWLGVFRPGAPGTTGARKSSHARVTVGERPLRVLFGLRPSAERIFGGDVVQIRETAQALRDRGHTVDVSTALRPDARGYDVVHLSNLTVPDETLPQVQSVREFDGPVVMMPIFTDHADEAVWGMNASTTLFVIGGDQSNLRENLDRIEARTIGGKGWDPPPQRNDIVQDYTRKQREIVAGVDFLIANAHTEANHIYRHLACDVPYAIAPSCANPAVYGTHARSAFVERFGLQDFVVLPGRYEARKNQLMFFEAMRGLGLPVLYIGTSNEASMAKIFRLRRPDDAAFIGHLPESELAGAFAAARVVAIPSWSEVVSLTSLNAAISEASMVLSRNGCEHEYFADDAEYCDPGSIRSIRDAVQRAWETHAQRAQRRRELAQRVLREYTWERSAQLTEAAYYRALAFNPRGERRRGAAGV